MPAASHAPRIAELARLAEDARRDKNWKRWGTYLPERQWGSVREDYSADGESWNYLTYEQAMSRAYRWGEDGLLGICDRECRLCFAPTFWNERDPFLKERLFGLSGPEGNHGEDVKECYYYVDATPTHSYARAHYKYPQQEFPYQQLREENRRRGLGEPEYEILDTKIFEGNRYFDITVEYAKGGPNDLLIILTAINRGPEISRLHVLPTLWFRNTWSWKTREDPTVETKPQLRKMPEGFIQCDHSTLGRFRLEVESRGGEAPVMLFTDNETNRERLYQAANPSPYVKDAFHEWVVRGRREAVNPQLIGTKAAVHEVWSLAPGEQRQIRLRLYQEAEKPTQIFGKAFHAVFEKRLREADEFYTHIFTKGSGPRASAKPIPPTEAQRISRQAYAGLLWSKQFYHFVVSEWLDGDPGQPAPPAERKLGRNLEWRHLYARDVLSMPDKWEYPWFAAWDTAFHMLPFARIDPHFAKDQLNLLLREWYMHPNGQMPAYEWNFSDVNPPVHAWACWRVYKMTGEKGARDREFLARTFQKLLMNFTWWVNRKDPDGHNIFSGGFLGLDNIGVFDRSKSQPAGSSLSQADGTAWMAFYCGTMLAMALELAEGDPVYEDIASKFFEHFVAIAQAINTLGGTGLWNEEDGFYYDQLVRDGKATPLKLRSIVGLIPLFAVEFLNEADLGKMKGFAKRLRWFMENKPQLASQISYLAEDGCNAGRFMLAIPSRERLQRVLRYVFDEREFLSPYGIRSLSRVYGKHPYVMSSEGEEYSVRYVPGDSDGWLFGGNSNWRGPVWLPLNYLLIEALERYDHFYGETFKVEFPTSSGNWIPLKQAAKNISCRLTELFLPNADGRRPCNGLEPRYVSDRHWHDFVLFYEYFHGETGQGMGASHQTGWTSLVTELFGSDASGSS